MLDKPSKFWARLGDAQRADLEQFGVEHCKRRQALRYFTWTWRLSNLRQSEQLRWQFWAERLESQKINRP